MLKKGDPCNFKKCTEVLNLAISSAGKNYLAKHKS
jgi:hypothetical protein